MTQEDRAQGIIDQMLGDSLSIRLVNAQTCVKEILKPLHHAVEFMNETADETTAEGLQVFVNHYEGVEQIIQTQLDEI